MISKVFKRLVLVLQSVCILVCKKFFYFFSASQDGEFQQQQTKFLAEMQARKDAIGITNAICRSATDILHKARGIARKMIFIGFRHSATKVILSI